MINDGKTVTNDCRCECRRAVQHRVSAAAAVQSSGGTLLHEYPDFILPFIIQSLAHHPDFPTQEVRHQHQPPCSASHSDLSCSIESVQATAVCQQTCGWCQKQPLHGWTDILLNSTCSVKLALHVQHAVPWTVMVTGPLRLKQSLTAYSPHPTDATSFETVVVTCNCSQVT